MEQHITIREYLAYLALFISSKRSVLNAVEMLYATPALYLCLFILKSHERYLGIAGSLV